MFAYTARPESFEMTARRMTTDELEAVPQTFTNTLRRDATGRLCRGNTTSAARTTVSSLIPQSNGYHSRCAHMHKKPSKVNLSRTAKMQLPPANQKASNGERAAYDATLASTQDFTIESTVTSEKRTLNPHKGLNNANFGKTGRVSSVESKYIPSGYAGHIQNMQFIHGRTYSKIADQILSYRDDSVAPTKPYYHELV